MKTAVCKSGEKKQKAPYSAERSENNVAETSPVKLIKVENQSAVEEDSKVVQSSQLSDEVPKPFECGTEQIQVSWFTFDNILANSMELSNKISDKNTVSI